MPNTQLTFIPPVVACRGACVRAPENTMPAFVAAREDGARWIETDVKLTEDGVPVLMHDDTLDRTTNGQGLVADKSWADMQNLDAGSWFASEFAGTRIPRLEELLVFARQANMRLNLEIKPCPGRAQATTMVTLMKTAGMWPATLPPPLISSYDIETLIIAAQFHPGWPRCLLLDEWRDDWQELAILTQATVLNLNVKMLTPERTKVLCASPVPVLAYMVEDSSFAKNLLQSGIRAVFSEDPARVLKSLS